ncbi:unnamed protein product [Hermetia illucens]|uniref:Uncharacterized protein n=1 Tax=Hermetia illucens TaxID=343691 RepID=A0A7R8YU14_HERIL|nr:unnamed protein product [Hermetia illucens]
MASLWFTTTTTIVTSTPANPVAGPISTADYIPLEFGASMYNGSSLLRLPTVETPPFRGNSTQWKSFIDLFNAIIHSNSTIGPIQKMQYLLSYLNGDAKEAVSQLTLDVLNYEKAISALEERFINNNKMKMIYVDAFMDVKKV